MNLLGKTVKHKKLGKGTIISLDDTYIGVSFPTKDSIFLYPDAFDSFLTLESPSMQVAILHELTEKQIAKKIRHKEENEQRIAKALAEEKPADFQVLLDWLKTAENDNGIYLLGL